MKLRRTRVNFLISPYRKFLYISPPSSANSGSTNGSLSGHHLEMDVNFMIFLIPKHQYHGGNICLPCYFYNFTWLICSGWILVRFMWDLVYQSLWKWVVIVRKCVTIAFVDLYE